MRCKLCFLFTGLSRCGPICGEIINNLLIVVTTSLIPFIELMLLLSLMDLRLSTSWSMDSLNKLLGNFTAFLFLLSLAIVGSNGTLILITFWPCFAASSTTSWYKKVINKTQNLSFWGLKSMSENDYTAKFHAIFP